MYPRHDNTAPESDCCQAPPDSFGHCSECGEPAEFSYPQDNAEEAPPAPGGDK